MDSIKRFQKFFPRLLSGRYKVIRQLGTGGFSQTFLAQDTQLPGQPLCVVKQLKPQIKNAARWTVAKRLFDTEAMVLYQLGKHDQIPQLMAHFEENQEFYLVQEFIAGESLDKLLRADRLWTEEQVMRLLQDILQVLAFVHQQNVIHRDIKPSNLIRRRQDGRIVLIDFGAVKQVNAALADATSDQAMTISIGTQGYMPSEQNSGNPRFNSDLYAVGMIGIQALTGKYPHQLERDGQTGEVIWQDWLPSSVLQLHPEFAAILDRLVRYHFKDRYQTVTDPLQAIEALLEQHYAQPSGEESNYWEGGSTEIWTDPSLEEAQSDSSSETSATPPSAFPTAVSPDLAAATDSAPSPIEPTEVSSSVPLISNTVPPSTFSTNSTNFTNVVAPRGAAPSEFRSKPWSLWIVTVGVVAVAALFSTVLFSKPASQSPQTRASTSGNTSPTTNAGQSVALPNLPCRELTPPVLPSTKPNQEYPDGTRYYGSVQNGRPIDGRAMMLFPNGNRYDGEFKNGRRNGCGTYTFSNGRRYIGQFKDDQFQGLGIWLLGNGDRYVGEFANNRCQGEGVFLFKDGRAKRTTWKNGKSSDGTISCN